MSIPVNRLVCVSIFIGLVIAGRVSAQQQARSGDEARAIAGRLFDHKGQPRAGEMVSLSKVGDRPRDSLQLYTNDAGEFRFDKLSPGVYMIFARGTVDDQQQKFYRPGDYVTFRATKGGVITGTVADSTGEPMIGARVHTARVRDEHGRPVFNAGRYGQWQGERLTDDRGVYRFWGLAPGTYLVSVGGKDMYYRNSALDANDESAPTYHPSSSTPEAATEVIVHDGQEATGIDIRHRGESVHAIRGYVSGQVASGSKAERIGVMLVQAATGAWVDEKGVQPTDDSNSFVFEGVADGEYDLMALRVALPGTDAGSVDINAASPHRRVVVKGKDVTGVEMKLAPLSSIDGRVVLEAGRKPRCRSERAARLDETVIIADSEGDDPPLPSLTFSASNIRGALAAPDQRGDFTIRSLKAGQYRVEAQLPGEDLYVRSISILGPAQARPIDAGRDGIAVKSGQRVTGLTVGIQEGAASLRGRVVMAEAGESLLARLHVHLVPADRQESDNALRFAEGAVESDGSFLLTNIAPGRYWLLARPADESKDDSTRPLAWGREARAKLTGEAVTANNPIELQPCQRVGNHTLRYAPLAKTTLK
jgi:hypothetical protein